MMVQQNRNALTGFNKFRLLTDHKKLVSLIKTQDLNNTSLRCQRLFMRLARYNSIVEHVPGKFLIIPDIFSCNQISKIATQRYGLYINNIIETRPLLNKQKKKKLQEIRNATLSDKVLQVTHRTLNGWNKNEQRLKEDVAERTSYVWRVNYFDRWSRHIFSPNGDDESHLARMTFPGISNWVKTGQTTSSSVSLEQDGCVSVLALMAAITLHHEESRLVHGPLSLPC